jgi:hypothetical protein
MEKTLRKEKRSFLSVFQWLATIRQKLSIYQNKTHQPSLQNFATTPETSSRQGQQISFKITRN